jgi:hypothetical protein
VEICQWLNENKISSKYNFSLDRTSVNYAPYFDPDNDDYPELLHIAVRAWEEARKESDGTPKKRISKFVEDRYPHVSEGARDAIALIANWQKSGGRPPKTGG